MKSDKIITEFFLASVFILVLISSSSIIELASGAAANDTITVSINITNKTMVDINPSSLTWNGSDIFPGTIADSTQEANGYSGIWVENTGSTNITKIWFNSSYPSQRPFGTGDPDLYDPANFVVIANDSSGSLYFINRVEYREDDNMYIKLPAGEAASDSNNMFGRFKNNSYEYFFFVQGQFANNCTEGTLYYSTDPHTQSSTGDFDFTDNTPYVLQQATATGHPNWSVTNVTFGGETYCFAVDYDCSKAMFHKWNADAPGAATGLCSNVPAYFITSTLVPGNVTKAWVKASIPFGVPFWKSLGAATERKLTVFVDTT